MSKNNFLSQIINVVSFIKYLFAIYLAFPFLTNNQTENFILYQNPFLKLVKLSFKIDSLSAFFVVLISLIAAVITIYYVKYADEYAGKYSLTKLSLATHFFAFSMIAVVLANHVFSFLFAWEMMSLSSYLLVIYDHDDKQNINNGFIYFVMTHIATAFLLLAFLLMFKHSHGLSFDSFMHLDLSARALAMIFFLFMLACGIKAGMVPFHFWLPLAHPSAPSHVSALMSALMVKTPIYLLLRVVYQFLGPKEFMGYTLLAFGLLSALIGVIYALKEVDLKKLLAYSTIENIGLILISFALSIIFCSHGKLSLAGLALLASFFHIANHSIYKSALFMGAGSIVSITHTRNLDQMGGLIKFMPISSVVMLIPVMSAIALPFTNGFISEWLIYKALMRGMQIGSTELHFILPITLMLLAMVAGFVFVAMSKSYIAAFLGYNRAQYNFAKKEVSSYMNLPIALLSLASLYIGFQPQIFNKIWFSLLNNFGLTYPSFVPYFLGRGDFAGGEQARSFPSQALLPALLLLLLVAFIYKLIVASKSRVAIPWGCGYSATEHGKTPARAQYNSSSFVQPNLRILNDFYKIDFACIFKGLYFNFYNFCKNFRDKVHSGDLHAYLLYIFVALIGGLIYARYFA